MSGKSNTSDIWLVFNKCTEADSNKAICTLCQLKIIRGTCSKSYSTTPLWNHLKGIHLAKYEELKGYKVPTKNGNASSNKRAKSLPYSLPVSRSLTSIESECLISSVNISNCENENPNVKETREHCIGFKRPNEKQKVPSRKLQQTRKINSEEQKLASFRSPLILQKILNANDPMESPINDAFLASGQYLLKKEAHSYSLLDELLCDNIFADVTLTAEGKHIKAHRNILCLSSKYFMEVLSKATTAKSAIFFRDIKYQELKNLIVFLYIGEVTVNATDLDSFMRTAELLGVNGLCEENRSNYTEFPGNESSDVTNSTLPAPINRKRRSSPRAASRLLKFGKFNYSTLNDKSSNIVASGSAMNTNLYPDNDHGLEEEAGTIEDWMETSNDHQVEKKKEIDSLINLDGITPKLEDEKVQSLFQPSDSICTPEQCPFCDSAMDDGEGISLSSHLQIKHPDKIAYKCEKCSSVFAVRACFLSHVKICKH